MDRGAWWATVHGIARVGHRLSHERERERESGMGGDICTHIADALHCTIATNTTVKQVYSIKNKLL